MFSLILDQIKHKHYKKILSLTRPLKDFFNVTYFSYQKVSLDGRYSLIANHPDFLEYYLAKDWYKQDPFLISPRSYHQGTNISILNEQYCHFDEPTKVTLNDMEVQFGFCQSILFAVKNFDYYEIFFFSLANKNPKAIQAFFDHSVLVEKYMNYFRRRMQHELDEIYEIGINIANIKKIDFRETEIITANETNDQQQAFIQKVAAEEYELTINMKKLTSREAECLYWMIQGKTADETAQILNISKRTVEGFREKSRKKLGEYSYFNLIYKIGQYRLLDLLVKLI